MSSKIALRWLISMNTASSASQTLLPPSINMFKTAFALRLALHLQENRAFDLACKFNSLC